MTGKGSTEREQAGTRLSFLAFWALVFVSMILIDGICRNVLSYDLTPLASFIVGMLAYVTGRILSQLISRGSIKLLPLTIFLFFMTLVVYG